MNIILIGEHLGVYPFPLRLLQANHDEIKVMAYQCGGDIRADKCVKNANQVVAISKHSNFIRLAHQQGADLAITPEYSTPWEVIDCILSGEIPSPERSKLWVLGCESITPHELTDLTNNHQDHIWVCEPPARENNQIFYGISLYMFQAQEPDEKLCIVIQFKCADMAGDFERDYLINGSNRYILRNNSETSISLTTIICAESTEFELAHMPPLNAPYLILHPQMNSSPYQTLYKSYRASIFRSTSKHNITEIFSLNWARNSTIVGFGAVGGGSAYYMKPAKDTEPDSSNGTIAHNHRKGLYYSFSESDRFNSYRLSGDEYIFEFKTTKPSQVDSSLNNQNKSGPKTIKTYRWDDNNWSPVDSCDDQIPIVLDEGLSPIDREKVITLSSGRLNKKPKLPKIHGINPKLIEKELLPICWHSPENLESLTIGEDELPRGTMVNLNNEHQEEEIDTIIQRVTYLKEQLSNNEDHIPAVISDFKNNEIEFRAVEEAKGEIRHNTHVKGGTNFAALVFLGDKGQGIANSIHASYKRILEPNRLVTWYRDDGTLKCINDQPRDIMDDDTGPEDIAGER